MKFSNIFPKTCGAHFRCLYSMAYYVHALMILVTKQAAQESRVNQLSRHVFWQTYNTVCKRRPQKQSWVSSCNTLVARKCTNMLHPQPDHHCLHEVLVGSFFSSTINHNSIIIPVTCGNMYQTIQAACYNEEARQNQCLDSWFLFLSMLGPSVTYCT